MNIKKSLKDVAVLVVICAVFAVVLAAVNSITAPIIADRLAGAADEAYNAVIPGAEGFETVDLSKYTLPSTVVEAKRETGGKGYGIKLETKGYGSGMILIIGVSTDGKVTGATCVTSNETNGVEKNYGESFIGKDQNGALAVDLISGSTMTTQAYRSAVIDAINATTIFGGGSVDIRTEEEILSDNLNAALGLTDAEFTKMFIVETLNGVEKVYTENSGAGYVCVVDGKYVGVSADGAAVKVIDSETVEVTEGIDELKASAEAAVAIVSATELTEITLTEEYKNQYALVTKVQVTASGNYVVDLKGIGFGILGDDSGYIPGSGEHIEIRVSLSSDGKVIDAQTIYHSETDTYGGLQLKDGAYNAGFIGKTEAESSDVAVVSGCTKTTRAFKYAVLLAFETVTTLEGGAN